MIDLLGKLGDENQAKKILQIAEINLSDKSFLGVKLDYKKSFNKQYFSNRFDFVPIYSNNYNSGINDDFIEVFNLPFLVTKESKPKQGLGLKGFFEVTSHIPNNRMKWDRLSLSVSQSDYPNSIGDIGAYSINYEKNLEEDIFFYSLSNVRFRQQKYLTSNRLGYKYELNNKDSLLISISKKKYINKFQDGSGLKFSIQYKNSFIKNGYIERYIANQETYSFHQIGITSRKFSLLNLLLSDFRIETSLYDDRFEAFSKRRNDENFSFNLYSNRYLGYFYKFSFIKRKSNIGIFDTDSINLEIYSN